MKNYFGGRKNLSGLILLFIMGTFALCVIGVLLAGIDTYKNLNERDNDTFNKRTCAQYITTKVRQAENKDLIDTVEFDESVALMFSESIGGEEYKTYIYCYEGWLCEYYGTAEEGGVEEAAEFGERLLPLHGFYPEIKDGVLNVELVFSDEVPEDSINLSLYLITGEGRYEE